jgi:hypothetical protein
MTKHGIRWTFLIVAFAFGALAPQFAQGSEEPGTTRPPGFPAQFDGRLPSNNEYRRSDVAARRQLHQRPLGSTRRLD